MQTAPFDYQDMSAKTRAILSKAFGPNAAIRTDEGERGTVYVRIVSDKLMAGLKVKNSKEIWDKLRGELKEDAQAVALVLAFGTDQV